MYKTYIANYVQTMSSYLYFAIVVQIKQRAEMPFKMMHLNMLDSPVISNLKLFIIDLIEEFYLVFAICTRCIIVAYQFHKPFKSCSCCKVWVTHLLTHPHFVASMIFY